MRLPIKSPDAVFRYPTGLLSRGDFSEIATAFLNTSQLCVTNTAIRLVNAQEQQNDYNILPETGYVESSNHRETRDSPEFTNWERYKRNSDQSRIRRDTK